MAWVEDTGKRERNAKHFYDSTTGKWRAEFTINHRHYHDGAAWQDIDESIVDDGVDGFDKKCDKTRHIFRIKSGGNYRWYPRRDVPGEYVEITEIQYYTNRWRKLNLPAAVWKQQSAEWDMTNLYASITNTWHQVKTDFILKNSSAYTRLRFAITFVGLTYNDSTGTLTSTTDGLVWGHIPKPTAYDANEADVTVTQTYDGTHLEWNVVTTGATFPIYIDPTFTDGYGGDVTTYNDTYVRESSAATNYGTATSLYMLSATSNRRNTLIKFDVSSLTGVTITNADLYLYVYASTNTGNRSFSFYPILSANSDWTEATAKWSFENGDVSRWAGDTDSDGGTDAGCSVSGTDYNASAMGSFTFIQNDAIGTEYEVDLDVDVIQEWIDNNYGMVGICTTADINENLGWCSSDHATTGYRPKLVVEYTEGGGTEYEQAVAGAITPAGTVVNRAGKVVAGALTSAGALINQAGKVLAGAVTPDGALSRLTGKAFSGEITSAGVVAAVKTALVSLAGELTSAGALVRQTGKSLAGALTPEGPTAWVRDVFTTLSGAITPDGTLSRLTSKILSGELTSSGVVATVKAALISLAGELTSAGSLARSTAKGLSGSITPDGGLVRAISKAVAGALTSAGTVVKSVSKPLAGGLTSAGAVVASKLTGTVYYQAIAGALEPAGELVTLLIAAIVRKWQPKPNRTGYDRHLDRIANYYDTLRGKRR